MSRSLLHGLLLAVAANTVCAQQQSDLEQFKILSIAKDHDPGRSIYNFTVTYEPAEHTYGFFVSPDTRLPPTRVVNGWAGGITFQVPDSHQSPALYTVVSPDLSYTFFLRANGEARQADDQIPSVVTSTDPETAIRFRRGQDVSNFTVGTRLVDPVRTMGEVGESLSYQVLAIKSEYEMEQPFSGLVDTDPGEVLEMVDFEATAGEVVYTLSLSQRVGKRGFLLLHHTVRFRCTGSCAVEGIAAMRLVPYFREGVYELTSGSVVPHYGRRPYDSLHQFLVHVTRKSRTPTRCRRGESCTLICQVFGGGTPTASFIDPAYLSEFDGDDDNVNYVNFRDLPDDVKRWAIQFGHMAFSFIHFQAVPVAASGAYVCSGQDLGARMIKVHTVFLEVEDA